MNSNYLLNSKYKKIGWIVLIPSIIIGLICLTLNIEPSFLDWNVPTIVTKELLGDTIIFGIIKNNVLNEFFGILIIISSLVVAFSKEKEEDEFILKIRLESLVWAIFINYTILLISLLFIFDLTFLWVMIYNMFTVLIVFIIRFQWQIFKLKNALKYEK